MSNKRIKKKKANRTKGVRGIFRKEHFENGGSPAEWTGLSVVHKDKKEKRNSRGKVKKDFIKESEE